MKLRSLLHPLLALLLLLSTTGYRSHAHALAVGGTITLTATDAGGQGKDASGHPAFIGGSQGKNQSTGALDFMNGAAVVTADTSNLVNGTGSHHGSVIMSKGADKVMFAWTGQVQTVIAQGKVPSSTFQGTWKAMTGAGRYAGIKGQGTYTGHFTTASTSVAEWKGSIGQ
jgi:hypothetical protein